MTWNIHHGEGRDGRIDLARIAALLTSLEPDLIGLQELDRGRARSAGRDQAAELSELIGMELAFHPTIAAGGEEYGLAVASSAPLTSTYEPLPGSPGGEPRGAVVAATHGISVLVTHMSRSRGVRRAQAARLAELVGSAAPPVVLMGDLNQGRWGLGALRAAGMRGRGRRPTAPAVRPARQIDHVLAGRGARVLTLTTVPSDASDHLPLVAEVGIGV